jgi:CheY-like chemotaxis protein
MPMDGVEVQVLKNRDETNILIVDDEPVVINFLAAALESEGKVQIADNGRAALEKVRQEHFDVIIADINMPVMNGIEFYRMASAIYPDIWQRILFFTGLEEQPIISFFEKNRLAYLIKPVMVDDVIMKVRFILQKAHSSQ